MIFDAHLDLSLNAMDYNRDLRQPVGRIRALEAGLNDRQGRGNGTVSLPEMRRGGIGICVATQIARHVRPGNPLPGWKSPEQAWAHTQGQLAWYRAMEEAGEMRPIADRAALDRHVELWRGQAPADAPIGYILSLEGADSMVTLAHVELAYAQGLRIIGPAHYGPGTYAQGTDASGGLGLRGRELLREMDRLGMILDATHLCDESFWEALDQFHGPVWASHSNCRALVPHHRQFTDEQLRALIQRGAVIGAVLDAWMMRPGWILGRSTPQSADVSLHHLVDHIEHVCELAGNARHCGIGSDLDGEFGREQSPQDLDTIADLGRYRDLLAARGFAPEDVESILHGNFIAFLRAAWN